jgi:hypothetical protein
VSNAVRKELKKIITESEIMKYVLQCHWACYWLIKGKMIRSGPSLMLWDLKSLRLCSMTNTFRFR